MNESERFWAKVEKTATCWQWTACRVNGYGQFGLRGGERIRAHVYAYQSLVGAIPEGLKLDHLCRNRACVNPAHLEPVTNRENILRGVGATALNARKTHCKHGHEYTVANTYRSRKGRSCVTCRRNARPAERSRRKARKGVN